MQFTLADLVGSVGVSLLLAAFALNIAGRLHTGSRLHAGMNMLGAGLAAIASLLIPYWPFVALESVWCLVAAFALARGINREST